MPTPLAEALVAWHAQPEEEKPPVAAMVKEVPELQPLFCARTGGRASAQHRERPSPCAALCGSADDLTAQANFLYGQKRDDARGAGRVPSLAGWRADR